MKFNARCYDRLKDGLRPACQEACTTGAIQFGPKAMVREARDRVNYLITALEAQLYGVDLRSENYDQLDSFYLLMDKPEVYGLPSDPVTPTKYMAGDYLRGNDNAHSLSGGCCGLFSLRRNR